ncbi:MAG: thioredoxin domain-containing protein [Hyphomicrobiales bacterium]|nr:thioredoxin domain-containing protein [Hyphomicrobiales bacterium]
MKSGILSTTFLGLFLMVSSGETNAAGTPDTSREANHLLGVESPYLQQHVYNPVDWYPWGKEALDKARIEGKPIFLSIGYSTCHWCHVMARESFEDEQIGKYLNENFVSIKIDRERRPDLDEQFMLVTQVVAGNGGWPNSVFLTSDGDPFYAGTYFPPDVFMNILGQVNDLWKNENADIRGEGVRIAGIIKNYMNRTEAAKNLTPEVIRSAARSLLSNIDEFNGGFGVAPKFPQESALLFMLDQAERDGDRQLLNSVTKALDGMIKGGIHDHVGGGFHRYSTDPEWHVPHFEKMLYNQAMIGRLLVKAWLATGEIRFKHAAIRTFDYVLGEMRDEKGGFYSAEDADSLSVSGEEGEGFFYIWTPEQMSRILGDDASFAMNALGVTPEGNFEGSTVLHMSELPSISAKKTGIDEAQYLQRLDGIYLKLYKERKKRTAPHKDKKIVVAWNAMMIETLAEASRAFNRDDYYRAAEDATRYILDEMMGEDGLKRVSFEGSIGVEAQLPDHAGLGKALISLYDYTPSGHDASHYLSKANDIANETTRRYVNEKNSSSSAYAMSASGDGIGRFIPYADSEVPSGNALALSMLTGLSKRGNGPQFAQKATLLAASLSGHVLTSPVSTGYTLLSANALSHGDVGNVRFLADGAVRVGTTIDRANSRIDFLIEVKEGWHINANVPLEEYFIPTQLFVGGKEVPGEVYPDALVKSLKFNDKPMALYEGEISLSGELPAKPDGQEKSVGKVVLKLQACSDQICLLPEEVVVRIW